MSLNTANVGPIVPVVDVDAARRFYEQRLGLTARETPGGVRLEAEGETRLYLLEAPTVAGTGGWPLASFLVTDIDATVTALGDADVRPIDVGAGFELDERGIARQGEMAVAWFRDVDGNVFTVFQAADT